MMLRALYPANNSRSGIPVDHIYELLQEGIDKDNHLLVGKRAQFLIINHGLQGNSFFGAHLIRVFASSGSLVEACQTFCKLPNPRPHAWAAIILAHVNCGFTDHAVKLYFRMRDLDHVPNTYCHVSALKACAHSRSTYSDLGKLVHDHIIQNGADSDVIVHNASIDMYVKHGNLVDARRLAQTSSLSNVVTWTSLISGYTQLGYGDDAFLCYQEMLAKGFDPNNVTFANIMAACSNLAQGRLIFADALEHSLERNVYVVNTFIRLCSSGGNIEDARYMFDRFPERDVVTWTVMIESYSQYGCGNDAIQLFKQMHSEVEPNLVTYLNLVGLCSDLDFQLIGRLIHMSIIERSHESDTSLGTALINMYAKHGRFTDMCKLFGKLPTRNLVTWTAMISGYVLHSDLEHAVECFHHMQQQGFEPNQATFVSLLSGCGHLGSTHACNVFFQSIVDQSALRPVSQHYYCVADLLARVGLLSQASSVLNSMPHVEARMVGLRSLLYHSKTHGNVQIANTTFNHVDCDR